MIPKIIHWCWFGGNPVPEDVQNYVATWNLIFNNKTGYRVDPEDAAQFAAKVLYLFDHPTERQRMQNASRELVRKYCDYSYVIEKLEKIIGSKDPVQTDYLQTEGK